MKNTFLLVTSLIMILAAPIDAQNKRALKHLEKGKKAMEEHLYVRSSMDFTHAIAEHPEFAEAYYLRGVSFMGMEQMDAAITDFEASVKYDPTQLMPFIQLIDQLKFTQQYERALKATDLFAEHHPEQVGAIHYQRGQCHEGLGNTAMAIAEYQRAAEILHPDKEPEMAEFHADLLKTIDKLKNQ